MTDPTPITVETEIARVTAERDGADAWQRQQDGWLARRYTTLTGAGMPPEQAAEIVAEYQGYLWGTSDAAIVLSLDDMGED